MRPTPQTSLLRVAPPHQDVARLPSAAARGPSRLCLCVTVVGVTCALVLACSRARLAHWDTAQR